MQYRELGTAGLRVSSVAFGAGPISGLMVGEIDGDTDGNTAERQTACVRRALELGINWFDTAATYGDGQSERSLGSALRAASLHDLPGHDLPVHDLPERSALSGEAGHAGVNVATKVRLFPEQLGDIRQAVLDSFMASLERLGLERVTLIQLHNSVTERREQLPTSVTPEDVLGRGGVVEAFEQLRSRALVSHFGFTGLGDAASLDALVRDGPFATVQIPYSLLTPVSGSDRSAGSTDVDYEELLRQCHRRGIGTIAIRVFAGGALTRQEPSPYTYKTKFFSLDLFRRDRERAERLAARLPRGMSLEEATVRFVLGTPSVSVALVGFASPAEIEEAARYAAAGPLEAELDRSLRCLRESDLQGR